MNNFLLIFTQERLRAFLDQIENLRTLDYPYQDADQAIEHIDHKFRKIQKLLDSVTPAQARDLPLVQGICRIALHSIYNYHSIIGQLRHSTNPRIPYELHGPLRDLTHIVLSEDITKVHLIISSDWDFSPYTIPRGVLDAITDFLLIGFPAFESNNPLLIPLMGHEIGHSLWRHKLLDRELEDPVKAKIFEYIRNHKATFEDIYGTIQFDDLEMDIPARQTWTCAHEWALAQCKEIFCDLVGLWLFGESFLLAFAYFLSPRLPGSRPLTDPLESIRAQSLLTASGALGYAMPEDFSLNFVNRETPRMEDAMLTQLEIVDSVVPQMVSTLLKETMTILTASGAPRRDKKEVARIGKALRSYIVPADQPRSLSDIINAAWEVWLEEDPVGALGVIKNKTERRQIVKEITLKNIQILEINQRLNN